MTIDVSIINVCVMKALMLSIISQVKAPMNNHFMLPDDPKLSGEKETL